MSEYGGIGCAGSIYLYREVGICRETAGFRAPRIREDSTGGRYERLSGPVEAGKAFPESAEKREHASRRSRTGRDSVAGTVVAGVKDRPSRRVSATVVEGAEAGTLRDFVVVRTREDASVRTDGSGSGNGAPRERETARRRAGVQVVKGAVSAHGLEGRRSLPERGRRGTVRQLSGAHPDRSARKSSGRSDIHDPDTPSEMAFLPRGPAEEWPRNAAFAG